MSATTHAPDDAVEVSVVMPCLNEVRTVATCVRKAVGELTRLGVAFEVIVADNGSTDGAQDAARAAGARVVPVTRLGYGSALQGGIAAAAGRFVLMGDADDSYDFSDLEKFVTSLRAGNDLVMGNRFQGGIRPGAMPWLHRYVGNPVLTGILNLFFRSPIGDAHCGLRGFRKDAYERLRLRCPGMEFASEMVVKACASGLRIAEVPVVLYPDGRDRPPHLRSFRDGWRHLRLLLLLCPLWLYLIPAGVLMGLGLALMLWLTPGPRVVGGVEFDVHSLLLGALCAILGYQTFWLWLFARISSRTSGVLPDDGSARRLLDRLPLERGLVVGVALGLIGLGVNGWLMAQWAGRDFGPLDVRVTLRQALWGFTCMVVGAQTVSGSFYLSLLRLGVEAAEEQGGGGPA